MGTGGFAAVGQMAGALAHEAAHISYHLDRTWGKTATLRLLKDKMLVGKGYVHVHR